MSDDGNEVATWEISLWLECPGCHRGWDVSSDCPDIEVGETCRNNEATCPNCGKEFQFNTVY